MVKKIKILNLYAGIGGNRKLWPNDEIEVTAVENVPEIAKIYKYFFPQDEVIVTDAHKYLLEHYKEFNFIWSSPPCLSHSGTNHFLNPQGVIRYPDMNLYQEIIFLKHFFKGSWVVENVISYYEPLIKPYVADRHYFWSNFYISNWKSNIKISIRNARASTRRDKKTFLRSLQDYHGFNLSKIKFKGDKSKLLANCVKPELGAHVFKCAFKEKQKTLEV